MINMIPDMYEDKIGSAMLCDAATGLVSRFAVCGLLLATGKIQFPNENGVCTEHLDTKCIAEYYSARRLSQMERKTIRRIRRESK